MKEEEVAVIKCDLFCIQTFHLQFEVKQIEH